MSELRLSNIARKWQVNKYQLRLEIWQIAQNPSKIDLSHLQSSNARSHTQVSCDPSTQNINQFQVPKISHSNNNNNNLI